MNGHTVIRLVAKSAPWIAPIPSGYFVGRSVYRHLLVGDPWFLSYPVAVVAGVVIEFLALAVVHTLLDLGRWNRQGRVKKEDGWERAPVWPMGCASVVYLVTVLALLVVLETSPRLSRFAPVLFPGIAVAGAVTLGVIGQHDDRKERYDVGDDLKVSRKPPQTTGTGTDIPELSQNIPEPSRIVPDYPTKRDRILAVLDQNPGIRPRAIVEQTGYSLSYVYDVFREWEQEVDTDDI